MPTSPASVQLLSFHRLAAPPTSSPAPVLPLPGLPPAEYSVLAPSAAEHQADPGLTDPVPGDPGSTEPVRAVASPRRLSLARLRHHPGPRALLVLLLAATLYLLSLLAVLFVGVVIWMVSASPLWDRVLALDLSDPLTFTVGFAVIAWMLPCVLLARRVLGPGPAGLLLSVTGRLRWSFLGQALLVSVVVLALGMAGLLALDVLLGTPVPAPRLVPGWWVFLLAAVLVVPLQAAAEEVAFRGLLMQTVGAWLSRPVFAVLLPVPLFVLGHGYNPAGQVSIAVFAVLAGWLAWRTGGLEAPIALHVANNSLITGLVAFGWADPNAVEIDWLTAAVIVALDVVVCLLLVRIADAVGLQRHRSSDSCPASTTPATAPVPATP